MPPLIVAALYVFTVLLGMTPAHAVDTELELVNTAPLISSVLPVGLSSPLFPVTPESGTTKDIDIEIRAEDLNGCNDITKVDVTVKDPDGATVNTETLTVRDSCTALTLATYTYTHTIDFYDAPGDYNVQAVVTDEADASGDNLLDLTSFRIEELVALSAPSTLDFGSGIDPGETTSTQSLEIQNAGNVMIDMQISGSALDHATAEDSIPVGNVTWSLASDMTGAQALTGSAADSSDFDLANGASSTKDVYWEVSVPSGLAAGAYSGTLTMGAVKST